MGRCPLTPRSRVITLENPAADRTGAVRSPDARVCIYLAANIVGSFEALPPENPRSRVITLENPAADRTCAVRSLGAGVCIYLAANIIGSFGALPPDPPLKGYNP